MDKSEIFIKKARCIHGDKYDYSKVEYINNKTNVIIICPIHGEFLQTPKSHLNGHGCNKCSMINKSKKRSLGKELFIEKSKKIHGDKYDYSKVEYVNNNTNVCIICPKHGEFFQLPSNHLVGKGCIKCSYEERSKELKDTIQSFVEKANKIHGKKYDYSNTEYINNSTKIGIICHNKDEFGNEHGLFYQTPSSHLNGNGCPRCSKNLKMNNDEFIKKAIQAHDIEYDYSQSEYINSHTLVKIICPKHGEFYQTPNNHISKGEYCPKCNSNQSIKEKEIYDFLKDIIGEDEIIRNDKKILDGKEIDILIPRYNIGIEFDGLRWHSEEFENDKNYHLNKSNKCKEKCINLIHIFEDEWEYKRNIIQSIIKSKLSINEKIYGRKCIIKEIDSTSAKNFLNENHIQGYTTSKINLSLEYNGEIVSVMTFGKNRINLGHKNTSDGQYEMIRFANKLNTNVIGGSSKLLKYFIKTYKPISITSYCDKRLFNGNMYEKLGFKLDHESKPNYFYVVGRKRENRFKFRKDILIKQGFNENKTEHEIMLERGIYRIYDCGCKVYLLNLQ